MPINLSLTYRKIWFCHHHQVTKAASIKKAGETDSFSKHWVAIWRQTLCWVLAMHPSRLRGKADKGTNHCSTGRSVLPYSTHRALSDSRTAGHYQRDDSSGEFSRVSNTSGQGWGEQCFMAEGVVNIDTKFGGTKNNSSMWLKVKKVWGQIQVEWSKEQWFWMPV